jgi:SPP1 gp7 family putative phage head morphogenesis protein
MAQDASPASILQRAMTRLARRWQLRIDDMAPKLAAWFATAAKDRAEGSFKAALREGGFTVQFKMTPQVNDVFQATLKEQVGLIKTIPQQYLAKVQGAVMRSVQTGRDIGGLAKELEEHYGVTKRRAQFIAKDQNNKATATIMRARQLELGMTKAVWMHSGAGRHPRPEHVAFSGKTYDVAKGAFLEGVWTWPGRECNCRCVSKSVLPSALKATT